MNIRFGTILMVGGAYFVGYGKGLKDGGKIDTGLQKIGDAFKDLIVEIGVEAKNRTEDDIEVEVEDIEIDVEDQIRNEKIRVLAVNGTRTNKEIADELGIEESVVRTVLDTPPIPQDELDRIRDGGERPDDPGSDAT